MHSEQKFKPFFNYRHFNSSVLIRDSKNRVDG